MYHYKGEQPGWFDHIKEWFQPQHAESTYLQENDQEEDERRKLRARRSRSAFRRSYKRRYRPRRYTRRVIRRRYTPTRRYVVLRYNRYSGVYIPIRFTGVRYYFTFRNFIPRRTIRYNRRYRIRATSRYAWNYRYGKTYRLVRYAYVRPVVYIRPRIVFRRSGYTRRYRIRYIRYRYTRYGRRYVRRIIRRYRR